MTLVGGGEPSVARARRRASLVALNFFFLLFGSRVDIATAAMAEAYGNRTHRPPLSKRTTGFEVQASHQTSFASEWIIGWILLR